MAPKFLAVVVSILKVAAAMPSGLVMRQANPYPQICDPTVPGLVLVANIGYFSDENCNDFISGTCAYATQETIDAGPGTYNCADALTPDAPFYVQVIDTTIDAVQILYTHDQTCPPSGPGAVFLTLVDNDSCVQSNLGGDSPGVSLFPNGGAGITRIASNDTISKRYLPGPFKRQNNAKCDGFAIDSEEPSQTQTVQISNIIDCTNGGGVEGVFSVEATFGMEFTSETTTGLQNGFSVDAGQRGYIGAYNGATLFTGRFTDCDSGDAEQAGKPLALRKNQIFYSIILTGAS